MKNNIIFLILFLFTILFSCDKREGFNPCDKDYEDNYPEVSTTSVNKLGNNIEIKYFINSTCSQEGNGLSESGICYSKNSEPTIIDTKIINQSNNVIGTKTVILNSSK